MSASIVTTTLFLSSIILLFSIPNISADDSLIKEACSSTSDFFDSKICNQILQSDPTISSTTDSRDFAIRLIEAGITNATSTLAYIRSVMKNSSSTLSKPSLRALQVCSISYDSAIGSFKGALHEVVIDYEYSTATYDLLVGSTDGFDLCRGAIATKGVVTDAVVLTGVKVVPIYGLAAYQIVDRLSIENMPSPPPGLPPWSHV